METKIDNKKITGNEFSNQERSRIAKTLATLTALGIPVGIYLNYMALLNPDVNRKGLTDLSFDFLCLAPVLLTDAAALLYFALQGKRIQDLRREK